MDGRTSKDSDRLFVVFRAGASIALLGFVLSRTDLRLVLKTLGALDGRYLAATFAFIVLAVLVNVYEWSLVVTARIGPVGFGRLLRYYLIGLFFNSLLPTAIGGDVARGYEMARETDDGPGSAGSILADRLVSGLTLGLAALLGLLLVPRSPALVGGVALFAAACVALVVAAAHPRMLPAAVRGMNRKETAARVWAARAAESVQASLTDLGLVTRVGSLALLSQVLIALVTVFIFKSLGARLDVGHALVCVPIISALTMLPVSISGIGVREGAYVYFFTQIGISAPQAVAASLLFFLAVALASLPGAPLFVMKKRSVRERTA